MTANRPSKGSTWSHACCSASARWLSAASEGLLTRRRRDDEGLGRRIDVEGEDVDASDARPLELRADLRRERARAEDGQLRSLERLSRLRLARAGDRGDEGCRRGHVVSVGRTLDTFDEQAVRLEQLQRLLDRGCDRGPSSSTSSSIVLVPSRSGRRLGNSCSTARPSNVTTVPPCSTRHRAPSWTIRHHGLSAGRRGSVLADDSGITSRASCTCSTGSPNNTQHWSRGRPRPRAVPSRTHGRWRRDRATPR